MKLKLKNVTNHLTPGDYQGTIVKQNESYNGQFLWLRIEVDEIDSDFNVSIHLDSPMFFNFAKHFANKKGELDTEKFLDAKIRFSVADNEVNDNIYSKLTKIVPVFEEVD